MNIKNNKRRRESKSKIEKVFMDMIMEKSINQISVTEICKQAGLNRTTFYANYVDVYDLADKICADIEENFKQTFKIKENHSAVTLFKLIYDNQDLFKVYFKLGYDQKYDDSSYDVKFAQKHFETKYIKYHIEFFKSGLNAIIKKWLFAGCPESPEEMADIIKNEYMDRRIG